MGFSRSSSKDESALPSRRSARYPVRRSPTQQSPLSRPPGTAVPKTLDQQQ